MKQHFRNILILILFASSFAHATEVDSYTYRNVPLADAKDAVNTVVNQYIEETLGKTNEAIQHVLDRGYPISTSSIESNFMFYWESSTDGESFSVYNLAVSNMEYCIHANDCKGWPKVERIVIKPEESIYGRAGYSAVASRGVAPVLNLCNVHIGADKLTHFLFDGRNYYNRSMTFKGMEEKDTAAEREKEMAELMDYFEKTAMGLEYTNVYSHADIYVNYRGIDFFKNIFQGSTPYLAYNLKSKKLEQIRKFDVCEYVDQNWDEAILKNSYVTFDPKNIFHVLDTERLYQAMGAKKLMQVIDDEIKNPTQVEDVNVLINRPYHGYGFWGQMVVSAQALKPSVLWAGKKFNKYSIFHNRRPVSIKVFNPDNSK